MQTNPLSKKILSYDDVRKAKLGNSQEKLVDVREYDDSILARYDKQDMRVYTGDAIFVRDSLAKKLAVINAVLGKTGCKLKVVYGYRHPEIQEAYFTKRKQEILADQPALSGEALEKYTHNFVAVPDVAGHVTGGAIDVTIVDSTSRELDMGTAIANYSDPEKIKTFAQGIDKQQRDNRKLLHDLMVAQGFAPFYGEWWHFSYGDREWAAFYGKKSALYGAIEIKL